MTEHKLEYTLDNFYKYRGYVKRVVDADTVDVILYLGFHIMTEQRLRIAFFDAPETWRPRNENEESHGKAATERAKELLMNKKLIFVTSKDSGIYGRFGASIILDDGTDYAKKMISEGYQKRGEY